MTKIEYLYELQRRLNKLPEEDRAEIMDAFEEHFLEGKKAGKTDAEIMEELGTVNEVAESLGALPEKEERTGTWKDYLNETLRFVKDTLNSVKETGVHFEWNIDRGDDFRPEPDDMTGFMEEEVKELYVVSAKGLDMKLRKGDTLNYIYRGESCAIETSSENGKGYIRVLGNHSRHEAEFFLEVPESVCVLDIRVPSGTVYAEDITPDTFAVSGSSADAEIRTVESKAFRFSSNSGDLTMADSSFEKVFVNVISGDIDIDHVNADLDIHTISGDIDISDLIADEVYLETKSGDITIEGETAILEAVTISGDTDASFGNHAEKITLKSVSGDLDLTLPDENFRAVFETVSGDISNETEAEELLRGHGHYEIGEGTTEVLGKTVSGDITIDVE